MKKIIETDLVSIAHKILQLKEKSDVNNLLDLTEKLYQKLILLKFYEDNKFRLEPHFHAENLIDVYDNKEISNPNAKEDVENVFPEKQKGINFSSDFMTHDIINDLVEDSKNDDFMAIDEEEMDKKTTLVENQIHSEIKEEVFEEEDVEEEEIIIEESQNDFVSKLNSELKKEFTQDAIPSIKDEVNAELIQEFTQGNVPSFKEEIREMLLEEINEVVEFTPSIEETEKSVEEIKEEIQEIEAKDPTEDSKEALEKVTLEIDPVYNIYHDQIFEQANTIENEIAEEVHSEDRQSVELPKVEAVEEIKLTPQAPQVENQHLLTNQQVQPSLPFHQVPINRTINDAFSGTIVVGLNDRIAFEKNLFGGSSEDLNRVISQLNTLNTYQEAVDFIEDLVKPDFNDWKGKEDYEERFMELVNKRFL